jgi:hypothetical protein
MAKSRVGRRAEVALMRMNTEAGGPMVRNEWVGGEVTADYGHKLELRLNDGRVVEVQEHAPTWRLREGQHE